MKSGTTGHYETVKIEYDVALFSYNKLLEVFFSVIDPIDDGGQFQDRGSQYRTAIFYTNEDQKDLLSNTFTNSSKQFIQKKQ